MAGALMVASGAVDVPPPPPLPTISWGDVMPMPPEQFPLEEPEMEILTSPGVAEPKPALPPFPLPEGEAPWFESFPLESPSLPAILQHSEKVEKQIDKNGLPQAGDITFEPRLTKNKRGDEMIERAFPEVGPKKHKKGWVDTQGRIWIKDPAHAGYPEHWDVQINGGNEYIRVGLDGNPLD